MPNSKKFYEITPADLPLCCPRKGDVTWNSHPKTYLAITETGKVSCPYCGTNYILVNAIT